MELERPLVRGQSRVVELLAPSKRDYGRQYAGMYWYRLEALKMVLQNRVQQEWSSVKFVPKVSEVMHREDCCIIGTVFCEMQLKPNVLAELEEDKNISIPEVKTSYHGQNDVIVLEDETGRVILDGPLVLEEPLCTGVVMAVRGHEESDGVFKVSEFLYPGYAPVPSRQIPQNDTFIAMISGLKIARSSSKEIDMLKMFLLGRLGDEQDQIQQAKVGRLIIAGDSFGISPQDLENADIDESLKALDSFISDICKQMPVDLLPGISDPASYIIPQQPIHKAMFPSNPKGLHCRTNPTVVVLEGTKFEGIAGQNLFDMMRYKDGVEPLEWADRTLKWRHLAPTAPDTLCCYPYAEQDPFILDETPHVYFIGNQPQFGFRSIEVNGEAAVIVNIPDFEATKTIALLDLKSLECAPVSFKA